MAKVLYQARPKGDGESLKQFLETHLISTQLSFDKRSSLSFLRYEPPQIFLMEATQVDSNLNGFLSEIRKASFDRPIVLIGKNIKSQRTKVAPGDRMVHLLDAPIQEDLLLNLSRKLLMNPSLGSQRHARFITELALDIEGLQTGEVFTSRMTNLSKGGAYCEFEDNPPLREGEFIKLNIPSDGEIGERSLNGKVVWVQKKSLNNPKPGLGVRFVGVNELYQGLLG